MDILFWIMFVGAIFMPRNNIYMRDFTNFTGFTIGAMGLTINGGFPEAYRKTGQPEYLLMSGLFAGVAYYCVKDEIKVIEHRKRGLYLK